MAAVSATAGRGTVAAALGLRDCGRLRILRPPGRGLPSSRRVHRAETGRAAAWSREGARPGVEQRLKTELGRLSYGRARTAEEWVRNEARRPRLIEVVQTLARSVTIAMALRLEAAASCRRGREHQERAGLPRARRRLGPHTARDVLTPRMDHGTPLTIRRARARGFDCRKIGRNIHPAFLPPRHARRFFHAEMHPGKPVRRP